VSLDAAPVLDGLDLDAPATLRDLYELRTELEAARADIAQVLAIAESMATGVLEFGSQFDALLQGAQGGLLGKLLGIPKGGAPAPAPPSGALDCIDCD
jgi:hypothetical protein